MAVYGTFADWEIGYLTVELRTGRFTGAPWSVVTVGESLEPVVTMGGMRVVPDVTIADMIGEPSLKPVDSGKAAEAMIKGALAQRTG